MGSSVWMLWTHNKSNEKDKSNGKNRHPSLSPKAVIVTGRVTIVSHRWFLTVSGLFQSQPVPIGTKIIYLRDRVDLACYREYAFSITGTKVVHWQEWFSSRIQVTFWSSRSMPCIGLPESRIQKCQRCILTQIRDLYKNEGRTYRVLGGSPWNECVGVRLALIECWPLPSGSDSWLWV